MDNTPLTLNTKPNAPTLSICGYCTKELPQVDAAVRLAAKEGNIRFNHGACINHTLEQYKSIPGMTPEKIQAIAKRYATAKTPAPPDLREHPELVQSYSQGNFFPQQSLKERLQKLANIIKDIKHGT